MRGVSSGRVASGGSSGDQSPVRVEPLDLPGRGVLVVAVLTGLAPLRSALLRPLTLLAPLLGALAVLRAPRRLLPTGDAAPTAGPVLLAAVNVLSTRLAAVAKPGLLSAPLAVADPAAVLTTLLAVLTLLLAAPVVPTLEVAATPGQALLVLPLLVTALETVPVALLAGTPLEPMRLVLPVALAVTGLPTAVLTTLVAAALAALVAALATLVLVASHPWNCPAHLVGDSPVVAVLALLAGLVAATVPLATLAAPAVPSASLVALLLPLLAVLLAVSLAGPAL